MMILITEYLRNAKNKRRVRKIIKYLGNNVEQLSNIVIINLQKTFTDIF